MGFVGLDKECEAGIELGVARSRVRALNHWVNLAPSIRPISSRCRFEDFDVDSILISLFDWIAAQRTVSQPAS